jgi:pSer/pThr/pTyr-binding forkhead associated (FHA) protein
MPKLRLQFDGRTLKEYVVGQGVTIGRLPDNSVVIQNPAVSGHHARILCDGPDVVLEDLKSTNGTFVNGQHTTRKVLRNGDVVLIGKHQLVFDEKHSGEPAPTLEGLGDTLYLDTKQHKALRASLEEARDAMKINGTSRPAVSSQPASPATGVLRVVGGRADQSEYDLAAHTSLIGRSDAALVRLRGWFKPDVAVAIARNGDGYVATQMGGRPLINSQPLNGRHHLKDGDILNVSGLTLEFSLNLH